MSIAFLVAAAVLAPLTSASSSPDFIENGTALNRRISNRVAQLQIPGVVVDVSRGSKSWTASYGVSDLDTRQKMAANMHVRVGSVTKTFVTTAALILADRGKIDLDAPVSKYVKGVPHGDEITVWMLGSMTSGLPSYTFDPKFQKDIFTNPESRYTADQLLALAFKLPMQSKPGTEFYYCNTNTIILGKIISRVTGKPLPMALYDTILGPLQLTHTVWPTDGQMPSPYAHGYTLQNLVGRRTDATFNDPSWANAAGELISTTVDLRKWARTLGSGSLLKPATQARRLEFNGLKPNSKEKYYGFGMGKAAGWVGHTGTLPGYNVCCYYLPSQDLTIVTIANSDMPTKDGLPASAIMMEITKVLTPKNVAKS